MIRRLHALVYGRGDQSELGRYGLGGERSVAQWAHAAGLDLTL